MLHHGMVNFPYMLGDPSDEAKMLAAMKIDADEFVKSHSWAKQVKNVYFANGVGGIYAIWLYEFCEPIDNIDTFLWIIVGDIPPAYLVTEQLKDFRAALRCYIDLMRDWIKAVVEGLDLESRIPVSAEPTLENAVSLETRLNFLERNVLSLN